VDGRDDGGGASDHGRCQVGLVEVANAFLDARECRGATGSAYHRAHTRADVDQRRADTRTDEAVGSGDYNDGRLDGT
jgi:hypothetical protein